MSPAATMFAREDQIVLERMQFAAQTAINRDFWRSELRWSEDYIVDQLVFTLTAFIYGKNGEPVKVDKWVTEARFPRWLPDWLCKRWSRSRHVVLDATPYLVWPDATFSTPEMGAPIRLVRSSWSAEPYD